MNRRALLGMLVVLAAAVAIFALSRPSLPPTDVIFMNKVPG